MDSRTAFSDSNDISNGSSTCCVPNSVNITENSLSTEVSAPDVAALRRLSDNLDLIFDSNDFDYFADAKIAVSGGREVAVHRCILSARSPYFKAAFASSRKERETGGVVKFELKELAKEFEVSFESLVAVLAYLYSGKVRPLPRDVCVCVDDECDHVACRPAVDFMVEVLYLSFTFQISELVALYQRHLLEILDKAQSDDILIVLSVVNMCGIACERLLDRCIEIIVRSDIDIITLDKSLPQDIVKQIIDARKEFGLLEPELSGFPDKHVKRIHRALDSDDVELVRMLLKEGHKTLDDAYALHYAVAYCDAKTTTELLDLGLADVNLKNQRSYTVLHVSAMRKEPAIIVSLLTKGAQPTDVTLDGRKALQISKRLTKAAEWYKPTEQGKASPKDRLCIEILEQAERRDPLLGEASVSLAMAGDDLRMQLLYLENRVGLAKLLFPMEAKLAMDIARVDGTSEFPLHTGSISDAKRIVDLNEVPFRIKDEHLQRLRALSKTVELGKRFFPRCSIVLDKIVDDDHLSELAYTGNDTLEQQILKRKRYMELEELVRKEYTKDKEAFDRSTLSSPSSSTSLVKPPPGKLTFRR
ncbi:Nitrogen permease reactivator protein [Ancistrocladus abbreviatus]